MAAAHDVSASLDAISQTPGAILYRDAQQWRALPPGDPGDVLILDENKLPKWEKPANVCPPTP